MQLAMKKAALLMILTSFSLAAFAQKDSSGNRQGFHYTPPGARYHPAHGVYVAGGSDGTILSFASVKDHGGRVRNLPRFSLILNIGSTVNYDFSNNAGFFSGLNLKNIGFTTRQDSLKMKRRVYTLGIPIGLKFGNFNDDFFFYFGAQYELALNYKEKQFIDGKKVLKFNDWFSDRTPLLMPSLFAGIKMHDFNVKVQYYPDNFFNTGFKETKGGITSTPYENLKANMFFVSFGYSFKISKHS